MSADHYRVGGRFRAIPAILNTCCECQADYVASGASSRRSNSHPSPKGVSRSLPRRGLRDVQRLMEKQVSVSRSLPRRGALRSPSTATSTSARVSRSLPRRGGARWGPRACPLAERCQPIITASALPAMFDCDATWPASSIITASGGCLPVALRTPPPYQLWSADHYRVGGRSSSPSRPCSSADVSADHYRVGGALPGRGIENCAANSCQPIITASGGGSPPGRPWLR